MMEELEQIIGYTFQNRKLLKQALTHSSYANEKDFRYFFFLDAERI